MSQKAGSAAANSLVFAAIFLFMVCQVTSIPAISRHRKHVNKHENGPWNRNVRIITNQINQIFKPRNSQVEIFRDHRVAPTYEKIVEKPTNNQASTSCGEITCDDVYDYPEERIIKLLIERSFQDIMPAVRRHRVSAARTSYYLKDKLEDDQTYTMNSYKSISSLLKERSDCSEKVKETHPKEGLTTDGKNVTIVNVKSYHEVKGRKCLADEYCRDDTTPENYVQHCTTKKVEKSVLVYRKPGEDNTDYLIHQNVIITDGCECVLERAEYSKY